MDLNRSTALSLRALLAGSVDYAGLFPPAGLALEPALENHAAYARGNDSWMLARFVLPAARLPEAGPLLAGRFDYSARGRLSHRWKTNGRRISGSTLGASRGAADTFRRSR